MGDAVDFKYYKYLSDASEPWSVKQDKSWGDNADAGFSAADVADPVMVKSPSLRPRYIVLQDPVSSRVTTRVCGSVAADAWTTAGYTTTVNFRGLAAGVVVEKIDQRGEHIRRKRTIISKPEPT
jgi:hypothetical protein